jgi:O-6-methylguanine DNA methyltransferase
MTPFERKVLTIVSRIPVGRVTTYGDVARMAGEPGAARAVGNLMAQANRPGLPYHRVIAAGGALGGYSSLSLKRSLLAAEGLTVTPRRVVGFAKIRWTASARDASDGEVSPKRREKMGHTGGIGGKIRK